jgi:hypothetical protein
MDLRERTADALRAHALTLGEHYVMCSAGYRAALPPDAFVEHTRAVTEGDRRGTASLQELTTALARLEARELMTRLTDDALREEADRRARATMPEVLEGYQPGDVDFTPRGFAVHRDVIRSIYGDDHVARNDAGFNLDVSTGRFDVYAVTLDDCRRLLDDIETGGDAYTGEEHTRFIGRADPTPIAQWRPNRFVVRATGYHGVLRFLCETLDQSAHSA